ncbi:MAG TPA: methyl-accepting chemotaxis protein [Spirochaetota bacterium]|nr:methyl-accepting chemotaxis protein [Spirochaetota bacterium]HPS86919.1 methyl-accepting chemotaxis protein [Spirochaetota bacterium]
MILVKQLQKDLFSNYKDKGIVERSSAQFLFIIALIFFMLMAITFIIFIGRVDFIKLLISCISSVASSLITMFLIYRGKLSSAASSFVIFQCLISIAGAQARTPEVTLVTIIYFVYPMLVMAAMFAPRFIQAVVLILISGLLIWNNYRVDLSLINGATAEKSGFIRLGTVMGLISIALTYTITFFVMKFLRLAISASENEAKITAEKNEYITRLIETIKNSYHELTGSINSTEAVITEIFESTQTQAATIEELAASIEEISENTINVENAAIDQNRSVDELSISIQSLYEKINTLQVYGTDLQDEFAVITATALNGKKSSQSINEINKKILLNSVNMQSIADIIDDFFDRINLLALNASIEAARAGEHGRGFAVVADEVGKLADNSSSELGKIKNLINNNRKDMESSSVIVEEIINFITGIGVSLVSVEKKAAETLDIISQQSIIRHEMLEKTVLVQDKSGIIKIASSGQSAAINEIAVSIDSTSSIVQNIAGHAQKLKSGYEKLKILADRLNVIISDDSCKNAVP